MHCLTEQKTADILTKPFTSDWSENLWHEIGLKDIYVYFLLLNWRNWITWEISSCQNVVITLWLVKWSALWKKLEVTLEVTLEVSLGIRMFASTVHHYCYGRRSRQFVFTSIHWWFWSQRQWGAGSYYFVPHAIHSSQLVCRDPEAERRDDKEVAGWQATKKNEGPYTWGPRVL